MKTISHANVKILLLLGAFSTLVNYCFADFWDAMGDICDDNVTFLVGLILVTVLIASFADRQPKFARITGFFLILSTAFLGFSSFISLCMNGLGLTVFNVIVLVVLFTRTRKKENAESSDQRDDLPDKD